jgi:hypothetical protein
MEGKFQGAQLVVPLKECRCSMVVARPWGRGSGGKLRKESKASVTQERETPELALHLTTLN